MKIPNELDVRTAAEPAAKEARDAADFCVGAKIENHPDLQAAVKWIALIKDQATALDEKRKTFSEPLREVLDRINAEFKPATEALALAELTLKNKVSTYLRSSAAQRDEVLASIDPNDGVDKKQSALVKADALVPPKIPGLSVREGWTGRVTDAGKLIQWAVEHRRFDLLSVDEKVLKAVTKAAGRDPEIPGWSPVKDLTIAITTSKVE